MILGFIIGLVIGAGAGVVITAVAVASRDFDRWEEKKNEQGDACPR